MARRFTVPKGTKQRDLRMAADAFAESGRAYSAPYVEKNRDGAVIGQVSTLGELLFGFRAGFAGLVKVEEVLLLTYATLPDGMDGAVEAVELLEKVCDFLERGHVFDPAALGRSPSMASRVRPTMLTAVGASVIRTEAGDLDGPVVELSCGGWTFKRTGNLTCNVSHSAAPGKSANVTVEFDRERRVSLSMLV